MDYNCTFFKNGIIVDMGYGLHCTLTTNQNGIIITGKLVNWNPITGIFPLKFKYLPTLLSTWTFLLPLFYYTTSLSTFIPELVLVFCFLWILLWSVLYWVKFYTLKTSMVTLNTLHNEVYRHKS